MKDSNSYSLVRFLHGTPRQGAVDIYLNGSLFFNRVLFTQFTPYIYVPEGVYEVTVFPTMKKDNPLIRQSIEIIANDSTFSTLALTGYSEDFELLLIPEGSNRNIGQDSEIRVVHLSPNLPEINMIFNNETLFSNVDFREVTDYINIQPDFYKVEIELSQNKRQLRINPIRIRPHRVYTLYILGNFASLQIFQSLDGATFINPVVRDYN
ncbi:DUF4397 domain-containing protein [Romboutsia sp.]|uniref:DUF4397 domain-containing protein n=1 Tax=Romboutsia sp. TaxID=1965302 RepID=UPI003F2F7155